MKRNIYKATRPISVLKDRSNSCGMNSGWKRHKILIVHGISGTETKKNNKALATSSIHFPAKYIGRFCYSLLVLLLYLLAKTTQVQIPLGLIVIGDENNRYGAAGREYSSPQYWRWRDPRQSTSCFSADTSRPTIAANLSIIQLRFDIWHWSWCHNRRCIVCAALEYPIMYRVFWHVCARRFLAPVVVD